MKKSVAILFLTLFFTAYLFPTEYFVVGELFSEVGCAYCPGAQLGLEDLYDSGVNIIPMTWYPHHSGTSARRSTTISGSSTPYTVFAGRVTHSGGSSTGSIYDTFLPLYQEQAAYTSPLDMTLAFTINSAGLIELNADVSVIAAFTEANLQIHFVLTIDNPEKTRFEVIANANQPVALTSVGQSATYTQLFAYDPVWRPEQIHASAFVQSMTPVSGTAPRLPFPILQACTTQLQGELNIFASDILSGPPTLIVNFYDRSYPPENITGWNWNFNGEGTSTEPNPQFIFDTHGLKTISLTVTREGGSQNTVTYTNMIDVQNPNNVSGAVAGIWSSAHSPYIITDNINISAIHNLTINPGVEIRFHSGTSLTVNGEIEISGAEGNEILFTADTDWVGMILSPNQNPTKIKYAIFEKATGSAINATSTNIHVYKSTFRNNSTTQGRGAAIHLDKCEENYILHSLFTNNFQDTNSLGAGAISTFSSTDNTTSVVIENSVFANNTGRNSAAINNRAGSIINIINCTLWNNHYTFGGSGATIQTTGSTLVMTNSLIDGTNNNCITGSNASITTTYSRIIGVPGAGNITGLPTFINETAGRGHTFPTILSDWILADGSIGIDEGNPEEMYQDIEDPNNIGYALYPAKGELRNDMGAFGGNASTINVTDTEPTIPEVHTTMLMHTYPNPFNPNLNISLNISRPNDRVNVAIYNIKGQKIIDLYSDTPNSTNITLNWNGTDKDGNKMASGIYFVRANSYTEQATKKVLLLK